MTHSLPRWERPEGRRLYEITRWGKLFYAWLSLFVPAAFALPWLVFRAHPLVERATSIVPEGYSCHVW